MLHNIRRIGLVCFADFTFNFEQRMKETTTYWCDFRYAIQWERPIYSKYLVVREDIWISISKLKPNSYLKRISFSKQCQIRSTKIDKNRKVEAHFVTAHHQDWLLSRHISSQVSKRVRPLHTCSWIQRCCICMSQVCSNSLVGKCTTCHGEYTGPLAFEAVLLSVGPSKIVCSHIGRYCLKSPGLLRYCPPWIR